MIPASIAEVQRTREVVNELRIPEDKGKLKLNRWYDNSTRLIVQITIEGALSCLTSATILAFVGHLLILQLANCKWQLMIDLPGATFDEETIESDSLTINFRSGGSCLLQASEAPDPEWPAVVADQPTQ